MKNLCEVLRTKEEEILRVKKEIEALKIPHGLLAEKKNADKKPNIAAPDALGLTEFRSVRFGQ